MDGAGALQEVIHGERQLVLPDGVALQASCWRPRQGGPWPALLMRQPYGRPLASTMVYAHPAWYAAHGYLVVVQDVRGCGDSGGSFRLFANEARDGSCTMAWLRTQPECNGRIGCYGFSYQGLTQLLWDGPDGPDCTAPAMAGLSLQHHWCRDGRADWWVLGLAWALSWRQQPVSGAGTAGPTAASAKPFTAGIFLKRGGAFSSRRTPRITCCAGGRATGKHPWRLQDWMPCCGAPCS